MYDVLNYSSILHDHIGSQV